MEDIQVSKATLYDRIAELWQITKCIARMRRERKERHNREMYRRANDTRYRRIESHLTIE